MSSPPLNSFGIPFYIPAGENNFLTIERDNPVTIHVGVLGVRKIFTLMQAYGPPAGDRICSVEFIGSAGADQTFNLIVGINVRDFFESCFSRTINNTTTQSAFEFIGRGGAYTDNTATGPRGFYDFDEQEYDLRQEFATQTLNSVKITTFSNWGTPFLLGLTAQTSAEPERSSLSFLSSYRFWIIVSVCVFVLAIIFMGVGIQRWLNAP
jgi:hypothetical protein